MGLSNLLMKLKLIRLKKRGLKIGENCKIYDVHIDYGHCFLIEIGNEVTITNSSILAHDASTKQSLGKTKVGRVVIGDRVFIGWGSTVLPNVKIGKDVIVAAGSIVNKDIPEGVIVAGVPAKIIGKTSDYIEKNRLLMNEVPVFSKPWDQKTKSEIEDMRYKLTHSIGFDE
ncbi:acyltransferase [Priestia megaterium]|uniref:acyltransferase n=1 Tax=Priestia megaterium TaxID=1404 RepID=UPI000BF41CFB|nr:acyltransferase [Priestia megaterium]MDH6655960.1 maltose O-acetyltransferase [Bacillus sp. PvP124]MED3941483.1 acyltransferase [Priestia megaterium]PFP12674.1 acetyltransferase [Priestia megaterium]